MCKLLHALPKCEAHVHIEGTLEPTLLMTLAARNNVALPTDDPAYASEAALLARYERFTSLDDFLHYYYLAMSVLRTERDFEDLAWAYLNTAHRDGVVHAEIFFDPQAHIERGVRYATVVKGLNNACERARKMFSISTLLICCFLRHLPPADALALFDSGEVQASFKNGDVVGLGLDSSENDFPPELFDQLYAKAQAVNIRLTAHAGEEGPCRNIATAISQLGCERIDHGIRLAEDPELMRRVAARGTLFTVCPLSNVRLRSVTHVRELPIRTFLDAGVQFSINSDDPAYFGGYILENYRQVHDAFELSLDDWRRICTSSIRGSWASTERKAEMMEMLRDTLDNAAVA